MTKQGISKMVKNLGGVISENSPTLLTGLAVGGVLTTAILTGTATIKAVRLVDEVNHRNWNDPDFYDLSKKEIVKLTWKLYIPTIAMCVVTGTCIIGANSINQRRNAALAALYSLSETAFREYKDKVVEEIGKNKELKVRDSIAQDRVTNNPVGDRTIIITGYGDVLCYDKLSDRYFRSSPEKIRQQVLELNYDLMNEMWLDLNDLYVAVGIGPCKLGGQSGFDIDKGKIEVEYSSQLTPEGQPCLTIDAKVYPNPRYLR